LSWQSLEQQFIDWNNTADYWAIDRVSILVSHAIRRLGGLIMSIGQGLEEQSFDRVVAAIRWAFELLVREKSD